MKSLLIGWLRVLGEGLILIVPVWVVSDSFVALFKKLDQLPKAGVGNVALWFDIGLNIVVLFPLFLMLWGLAVVLLLVPAPHDKRASCLKSFAPPSLALVAALGIDQWWGTLGPEAGLSYAVLLVLWAAPLAWLRRSRMATRGTGSQG